MIEAAIFLCHENNVIQHAHGLRDVESGGGGLRGIHGERADAGSLAGSGPADEICSLPATGVSFTTVPAPNDAVQVGAQRCLPGLLVTVPVEVPANVTVS